MFRYYLTALLTLITFEMVKPFVQILTTTILLKMQQNDDDDYGDDDNE